MSCCNPDISVSYLSSFRQEEDAAKCDVEESDIAIMDPFQVGKGSMLQDSLKRDPLQEAFALGYDLPSAAISCQDFHTTPRRQEVIGIMKNLSVAV